MADFLDLLETVRAEQADLKTLFGDAGTGVRHAAALQGIAYQKKLAEAAKFVADIISGRKPAYMLREVMTTSDFPLLFGDILDRQLLANYVEWPSVWQTYCARKTVPDFRNVSRFAIDGAETVLAGVPELTAYPAASLTETRYQYHVNKYGRRLPFSWEAMIDDNLDALKDIPQRFGRAAKRSEDWFATCLHVGAGGPDGTYYTNAHLNRIAIAAGALVNNPAISIAGLQAGYQKLAAMVDTGGDPVVIDGVILEVPPALEVTTRNILNAIQLWINVNAAAGTAEQNIVTENWMRNKTTLVVNPYLPIRDLVTGNSAWYLHATPTSGRPAFEMGFLRGHEQPEIFIKQPNAQRVGGGGVNPLDGDFDTDSVEYKVRHVFGGVTEEVISSVASTGAGGA